MSKARSIYVRVAQGTGATGRPWSLWWPAHKWAALTPAEQQAAIEQQQAAMGGLSVNRSQIASDPAGMVYNGNHER